MALGRDLPHRVDDQADDLGRGDDAVRGRPARNRRAGRAIPAGIRRHDGRASSARKAATRTMTVQDLLRHTSGPDLRAVRRLAGADAVARRQADGRGPDQRRAGPQARRPAADVRAGHDLGIQHVDRRARPRRRGRLGHDARRILRDAHHRAARHGAIPGSARPASAPRGSPSRRPIPRPASGRRCAMSNSPDAGIRAAAARSRPRPITCASARCC